MSGKFKIYKSGADQIIERLSYPKFKGRITFSPLSDIEDIELLEEIDSLFDLPKALREAGEFILKNNIQNEQSNNHK